MIKKNGIIYSTQIAYGIQLVVNGILIIGIKQANAAITTAV